MSSFSMEGESMESRKGMPSNGTESVLIKDPMSATSTLKVTPLIVVCKVRPLYSSYMTSKYP
jgi:hypothetical protein